MAKDINEMTMQEVRDRALELGFKLHGSKNQLSFYHWNFSQECKAYEFVKKFDPELIENEGFEDYPDDVA